MNLSVGFASTGSLIFEKKVETFTSRSSSGSTYWLTARVSSVILSSRCVFTSVPMPKQKMRVWPSFCRFDVRDDLLLVGRADGGTAIGEKDDDERPYRSSRGTRL